MERDYTNGELGIMLSNMKETMDSFHSDMRRDISEIKTQTSKTNGRVNKLENWRSGIVAVIAFLSFILPIIVKAIFKL